MIDAAVEIFEALYKNASLQIEKNGENPKIYDAEMYVPVDVEGKELETALLYKFSFDGTFKGLYKELKEYIMMHNVCICADSITSQLPGKYTREEALEAASLILDNMLRVMYGMYIAQDKVSKRS